MSKEEIEMIKNIWWSVHKEDHEMCERLQEGRSSPAAQTQSDYQCESRQHDQSHP